jgi:hypothetical protein
MALLGASIDPSLFRQDYSGFVNAANTNANAIAGLGQNISSLADMYKQKKKENKAMEGEIKAADTIAGILESKMPDAFPGISDLRIQMNDSNMSLVDRYNLANSIKSALSTGVQVQQLGLQQQRFDMAQSQAGQSGGAGGSPPQSNVEYTPLVAP